MRKFLFGIGISIIGYFLYVVALTYLAPASHVNANSGFLFVMCPIIVLLLFGLFSAIYKRKFLFTIGALTGFLFCILFLQLILYGA